MATEDKKAPVKYSIFKKIPISYNNLKEKKKKKKYSTYYILLMFKSLLQI